MDNFTQENLYQGPQAILQSGRLVLDAVDDVIVSSGLGNGMTFKTDGKGIHFNITDNGIESKFIVNAPTVRLGPIIDKEEPNIPAVKSDELIKILERLISNLRFFFKLNYPQTSGIQGPNMAINKNLSTGLVKTLEEIEASLKNIESKYVTLR